MFKVGSEVITPEGLGMVLDKETPHTGQIFVQLYPANLFPYPQLYEIEDVKTAPPARKSLKFKSWRTDEGYAAFVSGFEMGVIHANTGDYNDLSDKRCNPLISERDNKANSYPFGPIRGAFHAGYEDGYESQLPDDFWSNHA